MNIFTHPDFDQHEQVVFGYDQASGLKAIIAIHNSQRGPALGGCRMWPYASDDEALTDVLRLARGMTYKSAIANLDLGGGKSVIIGDPRKHKSVELFRAMGRLINTLGGRYIAAEDSGTTVDDVRIMNQTTDYVAGIIDQAKGDGGVRSGDPSPATAYGVFMGLKAAVKYRLGRDDLAGLKVAIQGVGNVGYSLSRYLHQAGAQLWVCDLYPDHVERVVQEFDAIAVDPATIFSLDVDVVSPCALGAILNDVTIPTIKAKVIAGAANNQLAEPHHGKLLRQRGILYAPDYVINAGGVIDIAYERRGYTWNQIMHRVGQIGATLTEVFERADSEGKATAAVADRIAEERFRNLVHKP